MSVESLAAFMYFLEQRINQKTKGNKLYLEKQGEATQKEWREHAQAVIRLMERYG